jgi:hypothetical protein
MPDRDNIQERLKTVQEECRRFREENADLRAMLGIKQPPPEEPVPQAVPVDQFWGRSPTFSANDVDTLLSPPHPAHSFATRREGLAFGDIHHYQSAGSASCGVHRVGNLLHHGTHQAP